MKTVQDIINLWKDWKPTIDYVSPYLVTDYYYNLYRSKMSKRKPLFPEGEINDVAAVIAGSKPVAFMDICYNLEETTKLMNEMIPLALINNTKYIVQHSEKYNNTQHIFYRNNMDPQDIIDIIENGSTEERGILLGYPTESIIMFIDKLRKKIEECAADKNNVYPKRYRLDENYMKMFYPQIPTFFIPDDWFE